MSNVPAHSILVGVDGSPSSDLALEWAVGEASRRNLPIHLVHARGVDDFWVGSGIPVPEELVDVFDELLEERVQRVLHLAPGLGVSADSATGRGGATLVALSRWADTVVLGARGRSQLRGALLGSVSAQVAAQAHCPVIVVRQLPKAGPDLPRVAVGVDGSSLSQEAIAYAFAHASSRGTGLTAVHAWWDDYVDSRLAPDMLEGARRALVEQRRLMVSEALAAWCAKYPEVDVRERLARAHPADLLGQESETAQLVVVGSRGRGSFSGLILGSVSQGMLHRAHCPVAVVRPEGPPE
jgi:nucleotide-binding universal stress UspA family protein